MPIDGSEARNADDKHCRFWSPMLACHPERSEGSPALAHESVGTQILRCAQDDMRDVQDAMRDVQDAMRDVQDDMRDVQDDMRDVQDDMRDVQDDMRGTNPPSCDIIEGVNIVTQATKPSEKKGRLDKGMLS